MTGHTMGEWKNRKITQAWSIIKPNGDIVVDSAFENERMAWEIILGYPSEKEIEVAKQNGYKAVFAAVVV